MTNISRDEVLTAIKTGPLAPDLNAAILLFAAMTSSADEAEGAMAAARATNLESTVALELALQVYLFAGFPRCINALTSYRKHFGPHDDERQTHSAAQIAEHRQRGRELFEKIYSRHSGAVYAALDGLHHELRDWILVDAYGKILARPGLDAKRRELCAVAALLVSGDHRQLSSHIRGAKHCGATKNELEGVLELVSIFVDNGTLGQAYDLLVKFV